jgi:hypothetical protein
VFDLPHVRDPYPLAALPAGVPVSRAAGVAAGGIELPALALAALLIALIPLGFDRLRRIRAPERLR